MSVVDQLAADLHAVRQALGVSNEMSIETIVCAVLHMRQESSQAETLRMEHLREVNALKDELGRKQLRLDQAHAKIDAAWKALGVDPAEAADDPDTAELADSIRVSLQHERDHYEQLLEGVAEALDIEDAEDLFGAVLGKARRLVTVDAELEAANTRAAAAEQKVERLEAVLAAAESPPFTRRRLQNRVIALEAALRRARNAMHDSSHVDEPDCAMCKAVAAVDAVLGDVKQPTPDEGTH